MTGAEEGSAENSWATPAHPILTALLWAEAEVWNPLLGLWSVE